MILKILITTTQSKDSKDCKGCKLVNVKDEINTMFCIIYIKYMFLLFLKTPWTLKDVI